MFKTDPQDPDLHFDHLKVKLSLGEPRWLCQPVRQLLHNPQAITQSQFFHCCKVHGTESCFLCYTQQREKKG